MSERKTILLTGAAGMIGSATAEALCGAGYRVIGVDRAMREQACWEQYVLDLSDKAGLTELIKSNKIHRIIHLAALAHATDGRKYSWEDYRHLNVECAQNVFEAAGDIPVLFISTVDVYGFTKEIVNAKTEACPVSQYAKSKLMAEQLCKELPSYTIFRFSPVYTDTVKRDIQKRYYLKYPKIAYLIGKGAEYEVLNIRGAVTAMRDWCEETPENDLLIIKDPHPLNTAEAIKAEKEAGRAKTVLKFPRWMVQAGYAVLKALTGKNKYTYLLNKAVNPLRTE